VPAPFPRTKASSMTASRRHGGSSSVSSSRRRRRDEEEPVSAAGMLPKGGIGLHPDLHPRHAFGRPVSSPSLSRSRSSAPGSYAPPSSFNPPSDKASARSGTKTPLSSDFPANPQSSLPDIENFDPTYGLRPEGPPTRSSYSGLGKLFETSKGLRELAEDRPNLLRDDLVADIDEEGAYDVADWEGEQHRVVYGVTDDVDDEVNHQEYVDLETIPAVGGGFITRPRIYQSQSSIDPRLTPAPSNQAPQGHDHAFRGANTTRSSRTQSDGFEGPPRARARRTAVPIHRDRGIGMDPTMEGGEPPYNPYFSDIYRRRSSVGSANAEIDDENGVTSSHFNIPRRTTGSTRSIPIGSPSSPFKWSTADRSISRSPPTGEYFQYGSPSQRQSHFAGSPGDDPDNEFGNSEFNTRSSRGIILRNQSVSQLTALSRSNQTLSPYTRSFSHFTVRSGPPKPFISNTTPITSNAKSGPRKATRKRIHRLDGGDNAEVRKPDQHDGDAYGVTNGRDDGNDGDLSLDRLSFSPRPPSEFSDEDVEHYFRTRRPSEVVHSPMRADRHLYTEYGAAGDVGNAELRRRTISHSSQRSRQRTASQSLHDL
jgi:distribution and morphology protein 34